MGFALDQAVRRVARRRDDISEIDRKFIELSRKTAQRRTLRFRALVGALIIAVAAVLAAWRYEQSLKERLYYSGFRSN
jgi:hypothetical protein